MKAVLLACVVGAAGCVDAPPRAIVHARAGTFGPRDPARRARRARPHRGRALELSVALHELDRPEPVWTVTCAVVFLSNVDTSTMLGNCVGNGILVVFAPDNLIGRPI